MLNRRDQFGPSVFGHADFHLPPVSAQADHREREITTQDFQILLLKDFRFAKKFFEKRLKISCSDFRRNVIGGPLGCPSRYRARNVKAHAPAIVQRCFRNPSSKRRSGFFLKKNHLESP